MYYFLLLLGVVVVFGETVSLIKLDTSYKSHTKKAYAFDRVCWLILGLWVVVDSITLILK